MKKKVFIKKELEKLDRVYTLLDDTLQQVIKRHGIKEDIAIDDPALGFLFEARSALDQVISEANALSMYKTDDPAAISVINKVGY